MAALRRVLLTNVNIPRARTYLYPLHPVIPSVDNRDAVRSLMRRPNQTHGSARGPGKGIPGEFISSMDPIFRNRKSFFLLALLLW
jgi:hypothetical protein